MAGAVIVVVVLLVAFPVLLLMITGVATVGMGWLLRRYGELSHPASEFIELNR
ncbi:MAG TPA: hypothetical protein VJ010_11100 [Actinomycetota bacterium]|nr:hypothetical protein [Actinomycetota bacterium]